MGLFNRNILKNRKVTKARFLYLYVIGGSVTMLTYFLVSIFRSWPKFLALTPIFLLVGYLVLHYLYKNGKGMWFYIVNVERGKLLLFLNRSTDWEETHKAKVANWAYPGRRRIRKEIYDVLAKKVMDGEELTKIEKKRFKHKVVFCPQQPKIGFNEALLVHALIYAHQNIQPLDDELRDIMELTDEHILAFDIMRERKRAGGDEYDRLIEIGKRKSEELKN